jgi:enoyl-CoA hydratase
LDDAPLVRMAGGAAVEYSEFEHLRFDRHDDGVLLITIDRPELLNATNARLHGELSQVWDTVDRDASTRVVVVTGAGRAFSAGGDFELLQDQADDLEVTLRAMEEARAIVYGMVHCDKPIISAINGVAVGAGLSVALLADISVMGETARFTDGHMRLGVGAGDHATILWPLLCGMAKTKYYLLTAEFIDGHEAERIGMVSRCVRDEDVLSVAMEIAGKLGRGPQRALRYTKRSLNLWLRQASPIFESSLALEMLNFRDTDVQEGIQAVRGRREAVFPSAR